MWKDNLLFYKSMSYLNFCTSIGVHNKSSPSLSANLSNWVYFESQDQFNPSMGSSDTCSGNPGQTSNIHVTTLE